MRTATLDLRADRLNPCATCHGCADGTRCAPARGQLRAYGGIRFTSDGFDCALPVSIDSHTACAYGCLYCFSDNLVEHRSARVKPIGQTPLRMLERIFAGGGGKQGELFRRALRYDRRNAGGYPTAVQLGALTDPCDTIERQQGWLLGFLQLAQRYGQPVRMSTKGDLLLERDYLDVIRRRADLLWVAFSLITPDDELLERLDRRAPNATRRLATMKKLSREGVRTSLRLRPMLPGASDATPKHPRAWAELLERAADAGARAVSYEVAFMPGAMTELLRQRWEEIESILGRPLRQIYGRTSRRTACTRPAAGWTEQIMHAVAEKAHELGMAVGVSDPVWKQLTDYGCCCGIDPADPVFGNWQTENATNALVIARDTGREVTAADAIPAWAHEAKMAGIVAFGAGPLEKFDSRHARWADHLHKAWDSLQSERGVVRYFQGALVPAGWKDGHRTYRYRGLERRRPASTPFWRIDGGTDG